MSQITGSVTVTGIVAPTDTTDIYAVTDAVYGRDGLRNVDDTSAMLAITKDRRRLGMIVGVGISGTSGTYYSLTNEPGTDSTQLSDWTVFQSGAAGSSLEVQSNGTSALVGTQIINFGSGITVSTSGTSGQVDVSVSGGAIEFYDEGTSLGAYSKVNFVGADVFADQKPGDNTTLNVYIPTPTFSSHFNTNDGTSSGYVSESLSRYSVRISTPTSEGSPFKTNTWAASTQSATTSTTPSFSTANAVTGLGGDSTITVDVYDADGTTLLATYTTPAITGDGSNSSSGANAGITVTISNYGADSLKYKANISVSVNADTILTANGLSGGRYHIVITNVTDSTTDGAQTFTYTQSDVFLDKNPSTPSFGGAASTTISESGTSANIVTKHLSGVEYYILGSKFDAHTDDIDNLNANTQGRSGAASQNFQFTAANYGLPTISEYAWSPSSGSFTGWTNYYNNANAQYDISDWTITAASFRYRGTSGAATATLFDPWNTGGANSSTNHSILVDTYSTSGNSTQYVETFNDEQWRKASDYTTSWDPTATLSNGEACVVGGTIVRPDRFFLTDPSTATIQPNLSSFKPDKNGANPNYSSLTGNASFYRLFYTTLGVSSTPIPSFSMVFAGTFVGTALSDLQNQYLKVFVRKIGATVGNSGTGSPPLLLHGAEYDFGTFNDGSTSGTDTPGIRLGSSSGSTINGTFGGFNATNGIYVEVQICNSAIKIDTITVAFN